MSRAIVTLCGIVVLVGVAVAENGIFRALRSDGNGDNSFDDEMMLDHLRYGRKTCKLGGGSCSMLSRCCKSLKCYRKNGLNPKFQKGECVPCIDETNVCQTNSQCCGEMICDKATWKDINGVCRPKRRKGPCWEDDQCLAFCKVRGSGMYGRCY